MKLIVNIIAVILLFLVMIGDTALFLLALLGKTVVMLGTFLFNALLFPFKKATKGVQKVKSALPKRRLKKKQHIIFTPQKSKVFAILSLPIIVRFKYFVAGVVFSCIFIFFPLLVVIFLQDLPSPRSIWLGQIPQTTKIYDRNGVLLYQIYAQQNRTLITLADVPQTLQEATIATEDKDFYNHIGFNLTSIIRSLLSDAKGNELQGGSTITQQLVKSALLSPETSIIRKIKEIILAFWTERIYSKNQILEMYFNQIPYGGTAWGVEAASEIYFGKEAKDLDLAQSAFLAGIPQAPTVYSPYGTTPNAWKKRQEAVLTNMVNDHYITQKEAKDADAETLHFLPPQDPLHAPHFVMYVRDLLVKKYGLPLVEKGGLSVTTTLDLKTQDMAQKVVADEVNNDAPLLLTNGAALITNPKNGDILAMVGSRDFDDPTFGNVNVTTSLRQPGSSIKVTTYSQALSSGFTAATILDDSPVNFAGYAPVNYDGRFHGKVSLRVALANSFNIPAVKTLNQIGIANMVTMAKKMGITTWGDPSQYGLSITLGSAEVMPVDMATVYGTLANGGVRVNLNPILKITDDKGNVLEQKTTPTNELDWENNFGQRVLDPGVAFIMSDILADNNARSMEFGPNSPLYIPGHRVSVKTGTTDEKRDNWTIGYADNYLVTVWVGNNDNTPMSQALASGITGAAPIWHNIMTNLLQNVQDQPVVIPSDVIQRPCNGRIEYFIKGTENSVSCGMPILSPAPIKH